MAVDCPEDCLRLIFKHLQEPPLDLLELRPGYSRNELRYDDAAVDLATCVLVCRAWHNAAQGALYEHVRVAGLRRQGQRLEALLALFQHNARLASMVKAFHAGTDLQHSHSVERILALLNNLRRYTLEFGPQGSSPSIGAGFLPTCLNSQLRGITLVGYARTFKTASFAPEAFDKLPESLETLDTFRVDLTRVKAPLPMLQRVKLFEQTRIGETLLLNWRSVVSVTLTKCPEQIILLVLTLLGRRLRDLCIRGAWLDSNAIKSSSIQLPALRNLHLEGVRRFDIFPPSLHKLTWLDMYTEDVLKILENLSRPEFLPHLREPPALYFSFMAKPYFGYRPKRPVFDASEYSRLVDQAVSALQQRGLTIDEAPSLPGQYAILDGQYEDLIGEVTVSRSSSGSSQDTPCGWKPVDPY